MRLFEPVFRPPSEADSLILQITVGCSHNRCTFCAMYRNKRFFVRAMEEVLAEIEEAAADWPEAPRVFLGDGDALAAPAAFLSDVLRALRVSFPRLRRITCYATPMNLLEKSAGELAQLADLGLSLVYVGLESGSDEVLRRVGKGATAAQCVEAVAKAKSAGIRSSVMVLLGLGGAGGWREHARATAAAVNLMNPSYLSALTWMPVREAPLTRSLEAGRFVLPADDGILSELGLLIENLDAEGCVFRANHASNPLPIGGRLNRDKQRLLAAVAAARDGLLPLRPHYLRGT
jgi:radical SAM superfamily enzyme YgiQ (UPF0313 family)